MPNVTEYNGAKVSHTSTKILRKEKNRTQGQHYLCMRRLRVLQAFQFGFARAWTVVGERRGVHWRVTGALLLVVVGAVVPRQRTTTGTGVAAIPIVGPSPRPFFARLRQITPPALDVGFHVCLSINHINQIEKKGES